MTEQKRRKAGVRTNISQLRDTILPGDVKPISCHTDRWLNIRAGASDAHRTVFLIARRHPHSELIHSRLKYECNEEFERRQEEEPLRWDGV